MYGQNADEQQLSLIEDLRQFLLLGGADKLMFATKKDGIDLGNCSECAKPKPLGDGEQKFWTLGLK